MTGLLVAAVLVEIETMAGGLAVVLHHILTAVFWMMVMDCLMPMIRGATK